MSKSKTTCPAGAQAEETEAPILLDADQVAALLTISISHFYKLTRSGRTPSPIRLGRSARWPRQEIQDWIAAGAPPQSKWNHIKRMKPTL